MDFKKDIEFDILLLIAKPDADIKIIENECFKKIKNSTMVSILENKFD